MSVAGGVPIPLCTSDQLVISLGFPTDLLRFTNFNFWCNGLEVEHKSEICKTKALLLIQAAFPSPVNSLEQFKRIGEVQRARLQYHVEGCILTRSGRAGVSGSVPVESRQLPSWDNSVITSREAPPSLRQGCIM